MQPGERVIKTSVRIYNKTRQNIVVYIGETEETLDTISIGYKYTWISPPYLNDPIIIVPTKEMRASYQLNKGEIYMLFWNKGKKKWDIKKIK